MQRWHGSELPDEAIEEIDTAGNWMGMACAEFATALSRQFGYQILAAFDGSGTCIHAFCRVRGELCCDAYGLRPLALIADEFQLIQADSRAEQDEEWGISEAELAARSDGGCLDEMLIEIAINLIREHPDWYGAEND